jgi:16S rRNA (adenine1518-N6/adenine1519-N6)-dimethyltransferase
MDLTDRQQLIAYLQSHGLYTKKSLGQIFLVDRVSLEKIVAAAELSKDDCVIEIGPGLGVLTKELVPIAKETIAIELDTKLVDLLKRELSADDSKHKLEIINADILKLNLTELTKDCKKYKVVANIPYYITSKIIRFFSEAEKKPESIVLLTQKEVAERICARPGEMSVLSVSVQYYGTPEVIDVVPKTSFFPMPEVDSAILRIKISNNKFLISNQIPNSKFQIPKKTGASGIKSLGINSTLEISNSGINDKLFFRCVHIGFASRRKTLLNNLSAGYRLEKKATLDILESVGLNEKTRAQELSVENWINLCGRF